MHCHGPFSPPVLPQGPEAATAVPGSPFLQWQQSSSGPGTSGAAAPQMKSLLHPLQQQPPDAGAEPHLSPAALLGQRLRSSPVCIPGKGMPRHSSSSQLQGHASSAAVRARAVAGRGWNEGGGGGGGGGSAARACAAGGGLGEEADEPLVRRLLLYPTDASPCASSAPLGAPFAPVPFQWLLPNYMGGTGGQQQQYCSMSGGGSGC